MRAFSPPSPKTVCVAQRQRSQARQLQAASRSACRVRSSGRKAVASVGLVGMSG